MGQIGEFFSKMLGTENWPPRWESGIWTDFHGWFYIISDLLIGSAYFTIPILLINFITKKKDVPFPKIFWLFAAFILACGTTHLIDALMFWWPAYRLNAFVRFLTAVASWGTIFALYKILPHAFSLKTSGELEKLVEQHTEELNRSVGSMKFLANAIPQMIWTAKANGESIYFNRRFIDFTGLSEDELKEQGWNKIIHPDDLVTTMKEWDYSILSGKDFQSEFRLLNKIGEYRWHLSRGNAQRDQAGNIVMWVGTNTDIEEHKLIEEKKDTFIGIASHELKTPLTSIKAYVQLMDRELEKIENAHLIKNYSSRINLFIGKLQNLINDLLDVSKIQAGKMVYNIEKIAFDDAAKEAIEIVRLNAPQHKIILSGSSNAIVLGDKQRIEQVFLNLLANAVKYSPGSDTIVVKISYNQNNVLASITDYGIGILESDIKRIFDRLYRVESTSSKFQGLGVGLFISSEIIKKHEGQLVVESELGKGSIFTFSLPVASFNAN